MVNTATSPFFMVEMSLLRLHMASVSEFRSMYISKLSTAYCSLSSTDERQVH